MKEYPGEHSRATVKGLAHLMLDDLSGINISGSGTLHVMAIGNIEIQGETVSLSGNEGIELYEEKVNADGRSY